MKTRSVSLCLLACFGYFSVASPTMAQDADIIPCVEKAPDGTEKRRDNCEFEATLEAIRRIWNKRHADNLFPASSATAIENYKKLSQSGRASQQLNASSLASALTTLVNKPGAPDFLSIALNSGAFAREEKDNVATFSTSLYALGSFFKPQMATDFREFQRHRFLRRFTASVSTGKSDEPTTSDSLNVTAFTLKYQFGTRDIRDPEFNDLSIWQEVDDLMEQGANALAAVLSGDAFSVFLDGLEAKNLREISVPSLQTEIQGDAKLLLALESLESRSDAIGVRKIDTKFKALEGRLKKRWLGSAAFGGKFMESQKDEYMVEGTISGYAGEVSITASGSVTWFDNPMGTGRDLTSKFGVELLREFKDLSVTSENLGSAFSLGFNYEDGDKPRKVRGQLKWEFFLSKGISFPLSVTWANRTEFVNEREVRGNFGISYDFTHLLKALKK